MTVHVGSPEPHHRALYVGFAWMRRILMLPRAVALQHSTIHGLGRDGAPLTLHHVGDSASLSYTRRLHFAEVSEETRSWLPPWRLRRLVSRRVAGGDIVVVELNSILSPLVPKTGYRTLPWIRQKIYLDGERYRKRRRKIEKVYGRKVRKYGYDHEITQDRAAFDNFYETLYVPYISSRYPDGAWLRSRRELWRAVTSGFLIVIRDGERVVSAGICQVKPDEIVTYAFGLAEDYAANLRRGALSAFYYFVVRLAKERGISTLDLRRCRPNTDDGVYRHKHRWGAEPVADVWVPSTVWILAEGDTRLPDTLLNQVVWDGRSFDTLRARRGGPEDQPTRTSLSTRAAEVRSGP